MKSYASMVRTLVQTGQEYLRGGTEKAKDPIIKIDKASTILDAKCFNDSKIDPKRCIQILAKLIYLFNQGQPFSEAEATDLFFSITRLLQTDDLPLKRLVFMVIKEMSNQPSIYIVTSSLLKDIHNKCVSLKRNSLRTIPKVLDPSNMVQVERYIKGLINDPDSSVSSAALLAGIQINNTNEDMVRKWGPEVAEKLTDKDSFVQYHSLALIGEIKKKDKNFLRKSMLSLLKNPPTDVALIQHLRMLNTLIEDAEYDSPEAKQFTSYVLKQVKSVDDSVAMEAAKIACQSPLFSNKDLLDVVKILGNYLACESTVKKYTVLKLYNSLLKNSSRRSLIVDVKQIEKVLKDKNLSLSSTAASILLRICSEGYLEKLFNQIDHTMKEMSNDYKVDVVRSLVNVLKTYPKQYGLVNQFLLSIMQKEDSDQVRREIVEVMGYEVTQLGGSAKTQCIQELARFLSYAKNEKIHFQILGIISREAEKQDITSQLLKNIIHEVYLQQGAIKACGLSTLIKISEINKQKGEILSKTISKFRQDTDQEVRERIIFKQTEKPLSNFDLDMIEGYLYYNCQQIQSSEDCSLLSMGQMRKWGEEQGSSLLKRRGKTKSKVEEVKEKQVEQKKKIYGEMFANHSTFKSYGELRKVNKEILITDPEAELQVEVCIFLFDDHLILEYQIENRLESTQLENVYAEVKHSGESFSTQHIIPAKVIKIGGKSQCYIGFSRCQDCQSLLPEQTISSILKYTAKQYSDQTVKATYEDQFSLENFDIKLSTYMSHWFLDSEEFNKEWENLKESSEESTFKLNYASKQAAVEELRRKFGMRPISTEESGNRVTLNLAGKYLGVHKTLATLTVAFDTKLGCVLRMKTTSQSEDLPEELINSID